MDEKLSYKFVQNRYPQARIEVAFAQVFNVPPERIKHLRGRIKHLMALGLPGRGAGKGARVHYGSDVIVRWLVALALEDVGVTPAGAVKAINGLWEKFHFDREIAKAVDPKSADNPIYLTLRPFFVQSAWDEEAPPLWLGFRRRWDDREYPASMRASIKAKWGSEGERHFRDNLRGFRDSTEDEGSWACTRNVTRDLKLVRDCLEPPIAAGQTDDKLKTKGMRAKS
jgi:hypothetical protein